MCIEMRTNIVLDEKLVQRAKKITGLKTKRDLVEFALSEIVRRHELLKLLELHHWKVIEYSLTPKFPLPSAVCSNRATLTG